MKKVLSIGFVLAVFLIWLSASSVAGQEEYKWEWKKLGAAYYSFLKIPQGARPVGMGGAYVAVADDINAIFWNPAGLTHITGTEYVFSYNRWLVNTDVYSGAIAFPVPRGVLGFSVISFSPEEFEETTIYQPMGTGRMVNAGGFVFGITYALKFTDKLSFGTRVRRIQETLDQDRTSTIDIDLGTMFYTGFRSVRIAMAFRNFGPDQTPVKETYLMPLHFNVAVAMEAYGEKGDPVYLTLTAENAYDLEYAERYHIGGELWLRNMLSLRGGYKINYDAETFSLGAGFKQSFGDKKLTLDFAYTNFGELFDPPLRISVGGAF